MGTATTADIAEALKDLGLGGQCVAIHTSLSSFGRVQDGARGVIRALLAVCDTILAPTYTLGFAIVPESPKRPRNGTVSPPDSPLQAPAMASPVFNPATFGTASPVDRDMGAIPRTLLQWPGTIRSSHPTVSWAGNGPHAEALLIPHPADDPLVPMRRLRDQQGWVLLLGVPLAACTALHLAEEELGRHTFIRRVQHPDGTMHTVRQNGCIGGADRLAPAFTACQRQVMIGRCTATAYPLDSLVAAAVPVIRDQPRILLCRDGVGCPRCRDAAAGGPPAE